MTKFEKALLKKLDEVIDLLYEIRDGPLDSMVITGFHAPIDPEDYEDDEEEDSDA